MENKMKLRYKLNLLKTCKINICKKHLKDIYFDI